MAMIISKQFKQTIKIVTTSSLLDRMKSPTVVW